MQVPKSILKIKQVEYLSDEDWGKIDSLVWVSMYTWNQFRMKRFQWMRTSWVFAVVVLVSAVKGFIAVSVVSLLIQVFCLVRARVAMGGMESAVKSGSKLVVEALGPILGGRVARDLGWRE